MTHHILLIDYDPVLTAELYIGLDDAGLRVFGPATQASEAFRILNENKVDFVFLDPNFVDGYMPDVFNVLHRARIKYAFTKPKNLMTSIDQLAGIAVLSKEDPVTDALRLTCTHTEKRVAA